MCSSSRQQQLWKYFNYFYFPLIKHSNCAFSANNWYIWMLSDKIHGESSSFSRRATIRNEMNRYINIKDEWDILYCSKTKGHIYSTPGKRVGIWCFWCSIWWVEMNYWLMTLLHLFCRKGYFFLKISIYA